MTLNSDLVSTVKHCLAKIGLNQGTFISGFIHFIANNKILPFKKLTRTEEETACKISTIRALENNECEFEKKKTIQKSINEEAFIVAKQVLQDYKLTVSHAIRMLYETFVITGKMPYQFELLPIAE
ncbi:hypothetical protein FC39_GL000153 [Lactobacillus hamsteri DSM 5661 = JCM 6256]|uniref:Uncharacterized protein n=1 Tax=Lactobacillus hamsteri DSM 5661 = JCM 6256 TaxID=1423754 RepID=A0A0R1YE58_9LACO|nr:hypothetical protein FC39_GL000153 [Lactobacillus hamsteri DSM 5661 = JCM 6256]